MAHVVDRETDQYWKDYGKGVTPDLIKAGVYPDNVALALNKIFWETTYVLKHDTFGKQIRHQHKPDHAKSPAVHQKMMENDLIWVAHEGAWMAVTRQSLALGTLLALKYDKVPT